MGSRFSYKAEDMTPIHVKQSFDYGGNDDKKEDEVKILVEEHPETGTLEGPHEETDATPGNPETPTADQPDKLCEHFRKSKSRINLTTHEQGERFSSIVSHIIHVQISLMSVAGNPETPTADQPGNPETPTADQPGNPETPTADQPGNPETPTADQPATNQVERPVPNQEIQTPTPTSPGESTQKKRCCCTMLHLVAIFIIFMIGLVAIVLYILCYFRDNERYLQFFGHMTYRPSLLLPPLIWFAALVKIKNGDHRNRYNSWEKVFENTEGIHYTMLNAMMVDPCKFLAFFIYLLIPLGVCFVKIMYFITTPNDCYGNILIIWFVTEIIGVFIFAIFFFLLYLKRLEVQKAFKDASTTIRVNVGDFDVCINAIKKCFKQYYPLRNLMLPLLYFLLFESIFGFTVFLSWNYNKVVDQSNLDSNTTSAPDWIELDTICSFSCSAQDFIHLKRNIWYNVWILVRHVMTILLPCWAASGIDMKYMWDDLTTDLYFLYSKKHEPFWEKITVFVKSFHPETSTYSTLNIIVPVVALASGLFTGQQL